MTDGGHPRFGFARGLEAGDLLHAVDRIRQVTEEGGTLADAARALCRDLDSPEVESVPLEPAAYDCVVVVTDHSDVDYERLVEDASLVVDLRNATGSAGARSDKVWKL